MDRRVSGGLILVMALLVALVVPKILNPPRLDGVALIAPPPPPPIVGDCISPSLSGYSTSAAGQLQNLEPVTVVPCTELHGSEIVRVVDGLPPPDATDAGGNAAVDDMMAGCIYDTFTRWNVGDDEWWPQANVSIGVVWPDQRQASAGQRWAACSVGAYLGQLDRPLEALSADGQVPARFGDCSTQNHEERTAFGLTHCAQPHNHEDFGYRELPADSTLTQDAVQRSCGDLVVRATGRPDLLSDPGLTLETEVTAWYDSRDSEVVTLPLPRDATAGGATCAVHTSDGRKLTASLRQLGDKPLPWAP